MVETMVETMGYLADVAEAKSDFMLAVLVSEADEEEVSSSLQSALNVSDNYLHSTLTVTLLLARFLAGIYGSLVVATNAVFLEQLVEVVGFFTAKRLRVGWVGELAAAGDQ